jgi:hypothetical protein
MRSNSYYKVRRVVRAVFWLSLLAILYLIATRIWVFHTIWRVMGVLYLRTYV